MADDDPSVPQKRPNRPTDFYGNPSYEFDHPGKDLPPRPIGVRGAPQPDRRAGPEQPDLGPKDRAAPSPQSYYIHDAVGPAKLRHAPTDPDDGVPDDGGPDDGRDPPEGGKTV
ncbi:hypothetical protein [Pseudoruegeria sp. SK021]|uniref:hypothetical protein n=1 Tax=Pseudoruegeria sp. SK021 TaxID=1933035 RepID=UPI000A256B0B|nr:hypothetical protein [Pseudoruegeria sp. SK021]OSP54383.1 hypothetical protein BV911_12960 [Pseudoruegeria sp. SK021]